VAGEGDKTYTQAEVDALVKERVGGLKANRDEALAEAKKAKAALKAFEGTDPEEYKRLKTAAEETERQRAAAEGDWQKLEVQLKDRHKAEMGKAGARATKLQKALEKRLVQAELTAAIVRRKGDPDLLLPHGERYVRVRETDDDFVAYVVDEQGNALVADGQGTPMTFDQLVETKLMVRFPAAFEGTGSSGGGASRTGGGAAGSARTIAAGDDAAFLANVGDIAKGAVKVAQ